MSVEWKNQALGISTDKLRLRWGGWWGVGEKREKASEYCLA